MDFVATGELFPDVSIEELIFFPFVYARVPSERWADPS